MHLVIKSFASFAFLFFWQPCPQHFRAIFRPHTQNNLSFSLYVMSYDDDITLLMLSKIPFLFMFLMQMSTKHFCIFT